MDERAIREALEVLLASWPERVDTDAVFSVIGKSDLVTSAEITLFTGAVIGYLLARQPAVSTFTIPAEWLTGDWRKTGVRCVSATQAA